MPIVKSYDMIHIGRYCIGKRRIDRPTAHRVRNLIKIKCMESKAKCRATTIVAQHGNIHDWQSLQDEVAILLNSRSNLIQYDGSAIDHFSSANHDECTIGI